MKIVMLKYQDIVSRVDGLDLDLGNIENMAINFSNQFNMFIGRIWIMQISVIYAFTQV